MLACLTAIGCTHAPSSHPESVPAPLANRPPAKSRAIRRLTFAAACVPNVLRLPVRVDIDPARTPNVNQLVFLRPLCVSDHGETTCHQWPDVLFVGGTQVFHGVGVGVVALTPDPTKLSVSLEKLDETMTLADALALDEAGAVIEDGCVTIPWSSEGVGTLQAVRGSFTRDDARAPWMFRPSPRICAPTHVPGDDRVFAAPLLASGRTTTGIPATGLSGVYVSGTIRGPQQSSSDMFVPSTFVVVVDGYHTVEWRR
ncbi:hypothetical protein BH11MYX3_BH11MYX3_29690 [soil metagenome]